MASAHNSSDPASTCQTMASAHNSSDPVPTCQTMASVQISSNPAPECQTMALEHGSLSPERKCQDNISPGDKIDTTSNELDLLFSSMFDELLNGSSKVVSKSSAVSVADAPNQRQQPSTPLNNHSTPTTTCQTPPITTSVMSSENINQAEPHAKNDEVVDDEFINIFSTPVQDQGETSSRHVDSELLNGSSKVVSKSSAVSVADAPNQRQQPTTPLNNHTTHAPTCQTPPIIPTVTSNENIYQAGPHAENDQVTDDEFINIFSTPVQDQGETLSRHINSSNMYTFYQRYPSEQR
nr:hypothetical protein [Tanacetum cinerariifolium]